ncbi:MAG TPA: hypothetical protein PKA41_06065 [Verrucomicrobiota bacterium]|nr:hypothetical protein [Verrucomicrobiota bacterium]
MKTPDEDKLLNEILTDDRLLNARQTSLENALAALRRRRQLRRTMQTVAAVLVLVAGLAVFLSQQSQQARVAISQTKPVAVSPSPVESRVQTLSDEELFALFPGQAVALIGKPGNQQFVVLSSRNHP